MTQSPPLSASLQLIETILEEKATALAAGNCRLTLTASLTREMCSLLYNCNRIASQSRFHALVGNVRAVRVNSETDGSHIPQQVYLSPFRNLTYLEVRNVDVCGLVHLSKLRAQLKQLVLVSCVGSLDDVLARCGGDKCVDNFLWSELHSLHVTSCDCLELDSGLRLTPWLKTLDLSFNSLSDYNIRSLSTLFSVTKITLNFNRLLHVPSLAPSARASLKILHLRQNQLETLKGLELLCSLEELDVAYNCISKPESLLPLSALPYLVRLCLECNPISYSKDYRPSVLQRVCTAVNKKKFHLDGQYLSHLEADAVGTMAIVLPSIQLQYYETSSTHGSVSTARADSVPELWDTASAVSAATTAGAVTGGATTPVNNILVSHMSHLTTPASSTALTLSARKRIRMREAQIVDTDTQSDPAIDISQTANEQTVSTAAAVIGAGAADAAPPATTTGIAVVVDEEHLATKQRLEELRRTFGQEDWLHSQAGDQVRQLLGWKEETTGLMMDEELLLKLAVSDASDASAAAQQEARVEAQEETVSDSAAASELLVEAAEDSIVVVQSESRSSGDDDEDEDLDSCRHVLLVGRQNADGTLTERLLAVCQSGLYEKDSLSGQTLISWSMSSLKSVTVVQRQPRLVVQLSFLAASQSCRQRTYVMEENDFAELEALLLVQQADDDKDHSGDTGAHLVRCLKCGHQFPKIGAGLKLRTVQPAAAKLPKGQLEEYPVCPHCGSDMIFDVDSIKSRCDSDSEEEEAAAESNSLDSEGNASSVEVMDNPPPAAVATAARFDNRLTSSISMPNFAVSAASKSQRSATESPHSSSSQSSHDRRRASQLAQQASFSYSYVDFSQVDHRLRLYCEMFLTSHVDEEFYGLVKAELVTFSGSATGLVVVTSRRLYLLKITADEGDQPENWLAKEASYALTDLCCIMTIIGNQGLVLQLDRKDGNMQLYLILLRDERRTKNALHFLLGAVEKSGLSTVTADLTPNQWMALGELIRAGDDEETAQAVQESDVVKSTSFLVCTSCLLVAKGQAPADHSNASVVVDDDRVALLRADCRWLLSSNVQLRSCDVCLVSSQKINNLVSLESFVGRPEKLRLYFLDEATSLDEQWTITLETREAVDQLVEAVRNPWEAFFCIELEINELDE